MAPPSLPTSQTSQPCDTWLASKAQSVVDCEIGGSRGYPAEALLHWGERDRRHSGQTLWFRLTMCTRRRSRCSTLTPHNSMSGSRGLPGSLMRFLKIPGRGRHGWRRDPLRKDILPGEILRLADRALYQRGPVPFWRWRSQFFSYVNNNPIVGYDPFGLRTKCILAGAVGQRILVCWDDGNGNGDDSVQILGRPNGPPSMQSTNAAGIAADFDP